jgi:hypothetical protein
METLLVKAGIISLVYTIVKFIDMRFLTKEPKPIKELVRDTIIVFISVVLGLFIFIQMGPLSNKNIETSAFTGKADF